MTDFKTPTKQRLKQKITPAYSVIIVGGGIVGLSLAALLLKNPGFKIALLESSAEPSLDLAAQSDARVSAITLSSEQLLQDIGVWSKLIQHAAPLRKMKVWDALSGQTIEFDSADLAANRLGSIVVNHDVIAILTENLKAQANIDFYYQAKPLQIEVNEDSASLTLTDGQLITASLLIGADGGNSWVREQMQVGLRQKSYEQQAIVAVIQSELSHQNTAWQNFMTTGPLGLLPLKDPNQSAIVWSCDNDKAEQLKNLSEVEFNRELTNASEFCLGKLQLITERNAISLWMRHADCYVQPRIALVGDAAHSIHPLAGQGVNIGLLDVRSLANKINVAISQGKDFSKLKLLRAYERERRTENSLMIKLMAAFKSVFAQDQPWWVQLRGLGIKTIDQAQWIKKFMMRYVQGEN